MAEPQYSDLPQGAKVVGYTDLPAGAKVVDSGARSEGDPRPFGPHPSATSPLSHFLPDINQRVASTLRPVGHPMEFLRGIEQNVKGYQAQRDPSQGNWFTRGLGVLGKGIADTASDYWEHPGHLVGDIATATMMGATGEPAVRPVQAEVGATEGIPWGSGGQGPISQRGRMIPPPEPPPAGTSTWQRTIPVKPESSEAAIIRGLDLSRAGTRIKPSSTAPAYEAPLPGVNVRPSVERLPQPTSALERASEPPAPANPSAVQVKPSIGRISEFTAKPVEGAITPTERASTPTAPAGVKPVEAESPKRAGARLIDYRLGKYADKFDRTSAAHQDIVDLGHPELANEANRIGFKGRSDWKASDFSRSGYGKYSHPDAMELRSELMDEADRPAGTPSRMRGVQSKLPTPEQEARIKKSMVSRDAAKRDLEKSKEPVWPSNYKPQTLSSKGGGGANYTAADLADFKARHGIK